jgi:hypothetical protein
MEPNENYKINEVELEKAIICLIPPKIIKIQIKENADVDIDDIIKIQEVKFKLLGDNKHFILFITPNTGIMSKEAREFAAGGNVNKNALAKAIVIPNLGMKIISNFFIKINKPKVEHKLFLNEGDALKWLQTKFQSKTK